MGRSGVATAAREFLTATGSTLRRMRRSLAAGVVVMITLAGCSGNSVDSTTTSTTPPARTTTSSAPATTTTTEPAGLSFDGLSGTLGTAVENVYEVYYDDGDASVLPAELTAAIRSAPDRPLDRYDVVAEAHVGRILDSDIAVVTTSTGDTILGVDDGDGWRVVGAHLAGLDIPAIYGPTVRHVMIVGSDARPGQDAAGARADSLHIVSANPASAAGSIVGIPRDSWVTQPNGRNRKFTDILALSGVDVLTDTARNLTGLELEGHVLTGFAGFVDLIDGFGEFEIDIPMNMADRASGAYFQAGVQDIDGQDALAFARNRTIAGGDFTRQLHGGVLISWIGRAVHDMGIEELPALLELLTEHTLTDLTAEQLLTITASLYLLEFDETPNVVVPGSIGTAGSASVVYLGEGAEAVFRDLDDGMLEPS